jgi:hypothetical protein
MIANTIVARSRGRDIGPIGAASRVVAGAIALAVPVAISGVEWWDVAAALVVLPAITTAATRAIAALELTDDRCGGVCSAQACLLLAVALAGAFGLGAVAPVDVNVAFWGWLGSSLLLGAAFGYGGCEVLAFPNALTGRRDRVGCLLFTPIDAAEARRGNRR